MEIITRKFSNLIKDKSPVDQIRVKVLLVILFLGISGETLLLISDILNQQNYFNNILILLILLGSLGFLMAGKLSLASYIFLLPFSAEFFRSFFTSGGIVVPALPLFILLMVLAMFLLDLIPAIIYIGLMLITINLDIPFQFSANFTIDQDPGSLIKRFIILDLITVAISVLFGVVFFELNRYLSELIEHSENLDEMIKEATSELEDANKKLQQLAITDSLTGLNNRRNLFEIAEGELARARRYDDTFSVAMLDLDHFKNINDKHGHTVGDQVLRAVAQRLRDSIREVDFVGRFGGDEFAVLMPATDSLEAVQTAERLCSKVSAAPIKINGQEYWITITIGITCFSKDEEISIGTLFDQADQAMYAAKRDKTTCVAVYSN